VPLVAVGHTDPVAGRAVQIVKSPSPTDAGRLPESDVWIGLDIRKVLARLGIDPGSRRLVDLGPPQKTKSLGRGRPVLKLTPEHLLRHTLGSWARLASKTKIHAIAKPGADDDLHGAMEADLDTLATYCWYGVRNRGLSAGWQAFDMLLEAPFRGPGDELIGKILERLLGKEVWLRLRGNRPSEPPEDMTGLLTHIAWGGFTLHARDFKLQGPMSAVLAVEEVPGLRPLED
jgi:hypothetical protein